MRTHPGQSSPRLRRRSAGSDLGCRSVRCPQALVTAGRLGRLVLRRGSRRAWPVWHEERDVATDIDLVPGDARTGDWPAAAAEARALPQPTASSVRRWPHTWPGSTSVIAPADDGAVATYIPELGNADPVVVRDRRGDPGWRRPRGRRQPRFRSRSSRSPSHSRTPWPSTTSARRRCGRGSGSSRPERRSTRSRLDRATGRPLNPMVNAGANAAAGLIRGDGARHAARPVLDGYSRFAGRHVSIDDAVEASERSTGHRNRAIGHLLRASGAIDGDADAAVERYFAQCSVAVTAARPRGHRRHPRQRRRQPAHGRTGRVGRDRPGGAGRHVELRDVRRRWRVALHDRVAGQERGVWRDPGSRPGPRAWVLSPPLDPQGNSVRGGRACRDIVRDLDLHPLGDAGPAPGRCVGRTRWPKWGRSARRPRGPGGTHRTRRPLRGHRAPGGLDIPGRGGGSNDVAGRRGSGRCADRDSRARPPPC